MAFNRPMNITNKILHYAILRTQNNFVPYKLFFQRNPVVKLFTETLCNVNVLYSSETWRKIWLTMIILPYDVRKYGYTLCADTFRDDNMVIVDGCHLRFLKLLAYPAGASSSLHAPDFNAVANKIDESLVGQPLLAGGQTLKDVTVLTQALREPIDGEFSPLQIDREAFIRCNYALMNNSLRKQFHIWLWENLNQPMRIEFTDALNMACLNYEGRVDWRNEVCRIPGSPMSLVFKHRAGAYARIHPNEIAKFIRHALRHLTEHNYDPDVTLFLVYGYLGDFMSDVQFQLMLNDGLTKFELFLFQPVAH